MKAFDIIINYESNYDNIFTGELENIEQTYI